jgi:hypothetical protein
MKNKPSFLVTTNPRSTNNVVATLRLNTIAKYLEKTKFYRETISKSGFELNPFSFAWEYRIEFNQTSGFLVLSENESNRNEIMVFIYSKGSEVLQLPQMVINCKDILNSRHETHFTQSWEKLLRKIYSQSINK